LLFPSRIVQEFYRACQQRDDDGGWREILSNRAEGLAARGGIVYTLCAREGFCKKSKAFLRAQGGFAMREQRADNLGLKISGWILVGMGIPFAAIGAAFMTIWSSVPMDKGDARIFGAVFLGVGLLMLIIGLALLGVCRAQRLRVARLMREGTCYDAEIVDAYYSFLRVNARPAMILECRYTDDAGATHLVKSAPQWRLAMIREPRDYRARVWVDPYNPRRYHVEVRGAALIDRPADYDDR
jgi:hypothetical protein